jgi:hypothetical protein
MNVTAELMQSVLMKVETKSASVKMDTMATPLLDVLILMNVQTMFVGKMLCVLTLLDPLTVDVSLNTVVILLRVVFQRNLLLLTCVTMSSAVKMLFAQLDSACVSQVSRGMLKILPLAVNPFLAQTILIVDTMKSVSM